MLNHRGFSARLVSCRIPDADTKIGNLFLKTKKREKNDLQRVVLTTMNKITLLNAMLIQEANILVVFLYGMRLLGYRLREQERRVLKTGP